MSVERILNLISVHFFKVSVASYILGHLPSTFYRTEHDYFSGITWKLTSFHMNYVDFGFIKRGVVGTLSKPLFDVLDDGGAGEIAFMFVLDAASFIVIIYVFSRVCDTLLFDSKNLKIYLKSVVAISPLGVTQIAYDVGRLDHINYPILALAIILTSKERFIASGLVTAFGTLIHEAFFVYGAPLVLAYAVSKRSEMWRLYVTIFIVLYCAVLVLFYGNSDVKPNIILGDDVTFGMEVWHRGVFIHKLPLAPVYYIPAIIYILSVYYCLYRVYVDNNIKPDLMFTSTFCPLTLFFVGEDYFRWSHLVMIVVFAAILTKAREGPLQFSCPKWRMRDAPLLLLLLPLGPVGVDMGFPVASKVISVLGGSRW